MNRTITKWLYGTWLVLLFLAGRHPVQAQTHGILRMYESTYATHFHTGVDLKTLLDQGNAGEASLEFWMRSTQPDNEWELTDMLDESEALSFQMHSNDQLRLTTGSDFLDIDLSGDVNGVVEPGTWHHVSLTFQSGVLRVYVNGAKRAEKSIDLAAPHRSLFFRKSGAGVQEIAEIRAWTKRRSDAQVAESWLQSFNTTDATTLGDLEEQGLYALLGAYDAASNEEPSDLGAITHLVWGNLLEDPPVSGRGVSAYTPWGGSIPLMEVRDDIPHPILENHLIYLAASKGVYPDKVRLRWNHIRGADRYVITKGASNVQVGTEEAGSRAVGDLIEYDIDSDLLPGAVTRYRVQAQGEVVSTGTAYGFVFHNGKISGKVQSSSGVGTPGVAMTFGSEGALPGRALQFAAGASALTTKNADVFRKADAAARDFLVEFWYRADAAAGDNTVFQLGNVKVQLGDVLKVSNGNGSDYIIYGNVPSDGGWHHYAAALTQSGARLYMDGVLKEENTVPYVYDHISIVNGFAVNAAAGSAYDLDELRLWDASKLSDQETGEEFKARLDDQVARYWQYMIGGKEDRLLLDYRFDLEVVKEAYNQAEATKGKYVAVSNQELTRVSPPGLEYAVYTDQAGNYIMEGINYGNGSVTLEIEPVKVNHTFAPVTKSEILQSSTLPGDYTKTGVDFTDESQFNVSGNVYYLSDGTLYPVPSGQTFEFASGASPEEADYRPVTGSDGQNIATDNFGQYNLSLPIGLQSFRVANPLRKRSFGSQSLSFDGEDDYAFSSGVLNAPDSGVTWSGWIKRGEFSGTVPALQTILQVGSIRLMLRDNTYLALYDESGSLAEVPFGASSDWQFFAFAYDQEVQTLLLYGGENNTATSGEVAAAAFNGQLYLGASSSLSAPLKAHLHLVERRAGAYSEAQLIRLEAGDYLEGDGQTLTLSYRFAESAESLRAVSSTPGSEDKSLVLLGEDGSTMPLYDASLVNPYSRDYKYVYQAQGSYAQGAVQKWNVTEPISGIDFYNQTRYGITGNLIIPCNNSLGVWDVEIARTDVISPAYVRRFDETTTPKASEIFNSEGTVFTVDGLLPGIYKVTLTNRADPSIEKTKFGVDLRQGWTTVDFEYRSPLQVEARVIQALDSTLAWQPFDASLPENYCSTAGNYILDQQSQYQVQLEFYEEYGEGNRCYVEGIEYYVAGDLPQYHGQWSTGIVGSDPESPFTAATGIDTVLVWTGYPNFTGDYTRTLDIQVTSRDAGKQLTAWVTGTLQDENQNFSLTYPNVHQVLYDPPGDGSSVSWASGSAINYSLSQGHDHSFKAATKVTSGTKHSAYMGAWVGLGGGSVVLYESSTGKVTAGGEVGTTHTVKKEHADSYSVSFDQAISTESGTTLLPGAQSDVFIGTSDIVFFAPGKTLSVSGCQASYVEESNTGSMSKGAAFVYSRWGIENTLIPGLEGLIATLRGQLADPGAEDQLREDLALSDRGKVDTIKNYLADIDTWKAYLAGTLATRQAVFEGSNSDAFTMRNAAGSESLPENDQPFSGGVSQTFTIGQDHSSSDNLSHSHNLELTKYIKTDLTVFNANFNLDITLNTKHEYSRNVGEGNSERESFTIKLSDNEAGDQFDVLFRQDPAYPTPVIVAKAGQSSCPVESNTVARQGVELAVTNSTGWADLDKEAVFDVEIRDLNKANEGANAGHSKTYKLGVPSSKLPSGAAVRVEGLGNLVIPRSYTLEPGEAKTLKVYVKREDVVNAPAEFTGIPLAFYSACDESLLELYDGEKVNIGDLENPVYAYQKGVDKDAVVYNSDSSVYVRLRDVTRITARFHEPCAGNLDVTAPVANWVVNSQSDNLLPFTFKPQTIHATFSKVRFEFALENTDEVQFSKDVDLADLGTANAQGYYTYNLGTEAIGADQVYRVRLVPVCGNETEGWQTNNPTGWITGNIRRSVPVITSFTPLDGAITEEVTAMATYNRALNATTVNPLNISLRGILGGISYIPKSAWFDHADDQLEVPDQDVLDLDSSYTVEFWVKPGQVHSDTAFLLEKGSNVQLALIDGNHLFAGYGLAVSEKTLDPDGWTHVAVVYSKGSSVNTLSIYLNGVLDKSVSAGVGNFTVNEEPLTIGKGGFIGGIDEVRIWDRALSEATIRTNHNKRLIGTEEGLQAYYVLDGNALAPEAIRDFTAKTSGTSAAGIEFVSGDEAAPMDIATLIQDIPLTVSTSADQTQVVIQPVASYPSELLEGALLTVTLHEGRIKDEFGNIAAGKSWTYRIDGNHIGWDQGNHTVVQVAGNSKSFELTLTSENASQVEYELTGLPMWLEVVNPEPLVNGYYLLPSGHTHPMTFTTASWLSAGTYTGQVKAKILMGAELLGIETVDLRVIVSCDASHLQVTPGGYTMAANLSIQKDGVPYTDGIGKTVLVRNAAGVLVGEGTIEQVGGQMVASLNVYADQSVPSDPVCTVYLWNDAICQETPIGELTFSNGASVNATLDLNYVGKLQYTLQLGEAGFYWLSFRASDAAGDTTLSLGNIRGFGADDRIETHGMYQGQVALYNGAGWSSVFPLSVTRSYLVYVAAPRTLQVEGYAVDSSYPVALAASPGQGDDRDNNAVGYLRSDAMTVAQAFSRMSPSASIGDVIVSRQGNAQFIEVDGVGAWVGSLTHLVPNQGYKIKVTTASVLRYASTSGQRSAAAAAVESPLTVVLKDAEHLGLSIDPRQFACSSHLTGVLEHDGEFAEEDYLLAAFADDEVRGVAVPQRIAERWYYFLTAYTNVRGDSLRFKWVNRRDGSSYLVSGELVLGPSTLTGTVAEPYVFRITEEDQESAAGLQLYQNIPNPVGEGSTQISYRLPEDGRVSLVITDLSGRVVKTLVNGRQKAGPHTAVWNLTNDAGKPVPKGVYLYTLHTANGTRSKRIIIQ